MKKSLYKPSRADNTGTVSVSEAFASVPRPKRDIFSGRFER